MGLIVLKVLIYLAGGVVAYTLTRRASIKEGYEWSYGNRIIALIFSLFSWIAAIFIILLLSAAFISDNFNKPAKW